MISASNHQLRLGILGQYQLERFNQWLQPFVRSPFSKSENTVRWLGPLRKIRIFRVLRQDPVGAKVDVASPIPLEQDIAIGGHQHRHGIGKQQHFG
jgi:hypothetical protein